MLVYPSPAYGKCNLPNTWLCGQHSGTQPHVALTLPLRHLPEGQPLWAATSETIPLHFIRSADCTGELVEISGTIHFITQTQSDGSVVGIFNYQGVTGVGLASGNRYHVSATETRVTNRQV